MKRLRPFASGRPVVAIAGLFAIWLIMLLAGTGPADRAVYEVLYAGHRPVVLAIARVFTALGEPTPLIVASILCALWLWYAGRGRLGLTLFLVALVGRCLMEVQKIWIARPRPDLEPHLAHVRSSSFPSGHATSSMIFYLALALALTANSRWERSSIAGAILLAFLIGTSRVMLGVHWPSDVIGGWAFGLFWVLVALKPLAHMLRADFDQRSNALSSEQEIAGGDK